MRTDRAKQKQNEKMSSDGFVTVRRSAEASQQSVLQILEEDGVQKENPENPETAEPEAEGQRVGKKSLLERLGFIRSSEDFDGSDEYGEKPELEVEEEAPVRKRKQREKTRTIPQERSIFEKLRDLLPKMIDWERGDIRSWWNQTLETESGDRLENVLESIDAIRDLYRRYIRHEYKITLFFCMWCIVDSSFTELVEAINEERVCERLEFFLNEMNGEVLGKHVAGQSRTEQALLRIIMGVSRNPEDVNIHEVKDALMMLMDGDEEDSMRLQDSLERSAMKVARKLEDGEQNNDELLDRLAIIVFLCDCRITPRGYNWKLRKNREMYRARSDEMMDLLVEQECVRVFCERLTYWIDRCG